MPERFGRYRLDAMIGAGGMGEVWRAFDTETDRVVALKRLNRTFAKDAEYQQRFERESRLAAKLQEPHIIPIHHYGEISGQLYIDMRLVDGEDLASVIKKRGPLPPSEAVSIVTQIASALDAAHGAGLIHRDVKPSNILITGDSPFAYLIDFGISRLIAPDQNPITADGVLPGTLEYMAPERFNGTAVDHRVDVYSLTCVLFEGLTGEKPFTCASATEQRDAHLSHPPRRPSAVRDSVPEVFNEVIGRGMAKKPDTRYSSATELSDAARAALLKSSRASRPSGSSEGARTTRQNPQRPRASQSSPRPTRVQETPPTPARWGTNRKVVATAFVAAIVLGSAAWWFRPDESPGTGIDVGDSPSAIALSPDAQTAYVTDSGSDTLSVVDLISRSVPVRIPVGDQPSAVTVSADGARAYITNRGTDTLSIVNLSTRTVLATVPVDDEPVNVALTGDGTRAYIGNAESASITVVDTNTFSVVESRRLSVLPWRSLSSVAVSKDGSRVLAAELGTFGDPVVDILDGELKNVLATVVVGENPGGIAVSDDGTRGYVANTSANTVSVIDIANGALMTDVPVAEQPETVVLAPDGGRVYVPSRTASTTTIIDTGNNLAALDLPQGGPMAVALGGRRAYMVDAESGQIISIDLP